MYAEHYTLQTHTQKHTQKYTNDKINAGDYMKKYIFQRIEEM